MFKIKNKILNIILYKIYKNIRNSINKEIIVVLYSTGIDSGVLKFSLLKLINKKNIILIHINHNTSKLDNNYKKFCSKIIKKKNIKIFIIKINKKKNYIIKENKLRIKREKIIKIFIKKLNINSLWTGHQKNDKKENNYIIKIKNKKNSFFYKKMNFILEKKKPFKNIKKKFLKNIKNYKWIEELNNLKLKNIRNIIRLKLFNIINNKRDVAERFKALPC